jgi:hypothetical protein
MLGTFASTLPNIKFNRNFLYFFLAIDRAGNLHIRFLILCRVPSIYVRNFWSTIHTVIWQELSVLFHEHSWTSVFGTCGYVLRLECLSHVCKDLDNVLNVYTYLHTYTYMCWDHNIFITQARTQD